MDLRERLQRHALSVVSKANVTQSAYLPAYLAIVCITIRLYAEDTI